jgi:DNA primase catalytic subunit
MCIYAGTAVSRVLIDAFEKLLCCKKVDFLFSGGRGFHIRVRDYKVHYWGQKTRKLVSDEVLGKLQANFPQLCEPLRLASSRLGFNLNIIMDSKVSKQSGKLTRAPFSVHQATGRICTFFRRPEDLTLIEQVPTIVEVLKSNASNPCRSFAASLDYLQSVI